MLTQSIYTLINISYMTTKAPQIRKILKIKKILFNRNCKKNNNKKNHPTQLQILEEKSLIKTGTLTFNKNSFNLGGCNT